MSIVATTRPETMLGDTAVAVHGPIPAARSMQEAIDERERDKLAVGAGQGEGRGIEAGARSPARGPPGDATCCRDS